MTSPSSQLTWRWLRTEIEKNFGIRPCVPSHKIILPINNIGINRTIQERPMNQIVSDSRIQQTDKRRMSFHKSPALFVAPARIPIHPGHRAASETSFEAKRHAECFVLRLFEALALTSHFIFSTPFFSTTAISSFAKRSPRSKPLLCHNLPFDNELPLAIHSPHFAYPVSASQIPTASEA